LFSFGWRKGHQWDFLAWTPLLALPLLFALTLGGAVAASDLEGYEKPEDLLREEGLFKQLKRALIENAPARFPYTETYHGDITHRSLPT
jgi:hypothetical protein